MSAPALDGTWRDAATPGEAATLGDDPPLCGRCGVPLAMHGPGRTCDELALLAPVPRHEARRSVAYANKADLDDLLRHARERGEVVLYVPGEGRVELTRIPGIRVAGGRSGS